ncbi:MAG: hypothetical protein B7Y51_09220 [Burkholderiales bacterium 28-67-8]|nr:MAG: hypothetical protein B7Y51_09220 [Burkholderiales bacterium 28-67-8]
MITTDTTKRAAIQSPAVQCHVTVFTTTNPKSLGKTFKLGMKGLEKSTAGHMRDGTFQVRCSSTAPELVALLSSVNTDQALSASLPINLSTSGQIVTKDAAESRPGALSRSKDCFAFAVGQPCLITLDYDPKDETLSRHQLWARLQDVCPAVAGSLAVWWCSGSSHIYNGDTEFQGLRGQRIYLIAADGGDIVRFGEVLAKRLWLNGHGRIEISASGAKLDRGLFDAAMFQPARLDFIGGSVCHPPLSQRRGAPVILSDGAWLDTKVAMPDLTATEEARYLAAIDDAKAAAEPAAAAARKSWVANRIEGDVARLVAAGCPADQARERVERTLNSALAGTLMGDFEITLQDGKVVTIGEVLDNRERYHGALCLDPLNPSHRGGAADGKLYLFGAVPTIYSFDDGGVVYRLRRQPMRLYLLPGCKAELASAIVQWLSGEPDVFTRGGVLVQVAEGGVRTVRKHRLSHLVGSRVALYRRSDKGQDVPVDIPSDVIDQVAELVGG